MLQQRFPALNIHRIVTSQAIFRRYSASEVIRYPTIIPSHNTHCSKLIISSNRCTIQLFKYINSHTEIGINSKTTGFEKHYDPIVRLLVILHKSSKRGTSTQRYTRFHVKMKIRLMQRASASQTKRQQYWRTRNMKAASCAGQFLRQLVRIWMHLAAIFHIKHKFLWQHQQRDRILFATSCKRCNYNWTLCARTPVPF